MHTITVIRIARQHFPRLVFFAKANDKRVKIHWIIIKWFTLLLAYFLDSNIRLILDPFILTVCIVAIFTGSKVQSSISYDFL